MPSENNELQHPARAAFLYFQLANSLIPRPSCTYKRGGGSKGGGGYGETGGSQGGRESPSTTRKGRMRIGREGDFLVEGGGGGGREARSTWQT